MAEDSIAFVPIDPTLARDGEIFAEDGASAICNYYPAGFSAQSAQIYGNLGPLGSGNGILTPLTSREGVYQADSAKGDSTAYSIDYIDFCGP